MVRLYRRRIARIDYWEAWSELPGQILVHHGRVGERGVAQRIAVAVGTADERLAALAERQRRRGFREAEACELGLVLVQFPGHGGLDRRAIAWMGEVLSWTGLGDYVGFDDSGDLTLMGEAIDAELAADVLSRELGTSGLPADAVIAVSAVEDTVLWPPSRRGERFDGP
jgi:predicted DNA-binding WGR domain protein